MELLNLLLGYVATQHGISEDAAAELLFNKSEDGEVDKTKPKDDALKALLSKDRERVSSLKSTGVDKTEIYNQAFDEAKAKVLTKTEKKLAKQYGIEETLKLPELIEAIVAKQTPEGKAGDNLDEDAVKKHPTYLALERAKKEEIETLTSQHNTKIEELQNGYARTETLSKVKSDVLSIFDDLKPVLSTDVTRATNQRNSFAERFESYDYEQQADGSYLVLKDGKRVEDGHGNPVSLNKLVQNTAEQYYDFAAQGPKGNAGNGGNESGGGNASGVTAPTTKEEYNLAIINASSDEEIIAIDAAYTGEK